MECQVRLTADTEVSAEVISSSVDGNGITRYNLTFQQTDGNSQDTVELNNVHEVYVTIKE